MRRHGRVVRLVLAGTVVLPLLGCNARPAALTVNNAAALGPTFRALGDALVRAGEVPAFQQENAPSLEVVRGLSELGKVPDVLAVADVSLLDSLVVPTHSSWYLVFASNALVLAYGLHSRFQTDVERVPWYELLQRPGVRVGRSDPRVDPSGYRALLAVQLAEKHYKRPGLAAALLRAMPEREIRRAEADLSALVETGDLDYIWTYRNLAKSHGLQWIELPPEVNLESAELADWYSTVSIQVPGPKGKLRVGGAPILFALTIPRGAPSPTLGEAFVRALLSAPGWQAARIGGLTLLAVPRLVGSGAPTGVVEALRRR